MFNKNDNEEINQDLHLADSDYRHLNLPKHENISLKEIIAQMQQSSLQPATEENASLYPFHINLAQADVSPAAPIAAEQPHDAPANESASSQTDVVEEIIAEEDESVAEDPEVLLLPDTADDVIRIELTQESSKIKLPIDDDGSQDLYRIKHNNNGLVQDEPRDLGIPPVEYPQQKLFVPFIPAQTQAPETECCSSQVEIKLTTKLIYLGDYCCGYGGEEGEEFLYNSNYGWEGEGEGGSCGCSCEPYNPPCPPTPNYTIIFNSCDGVQWLDLTICNSYGDQTERGSFNLAQDAGYDDCCTTYRIEIPASFGLDCDCPILTLQTDKLFISSPWELINNDAHFIDCHGNCYELNSHYAGSSAVSNDFTTTEYDSSGTSFYLQRCECEEPVQIALINQDGDLGTTSGDTYYIGDFNFSMNFISQDLTGDGQNETYLNFHVNTNSGSNANISIELPSGINCACPIEEWVFDETAFINHLNALSAQISAIIGIPVDIDHLGQILGAQGVGDLALYYFDNNGFFEDCHDTCYDLNLTPHVITSGEFEFTTYSYDLAACEEPCRTEINVTFGCDGCDTYNRFENWVADVAPGSFDPFKFFTDNFEVNLVDCNNTRFAEFNISTVDYSVGDGFYTTFEGQVRINLPPDFCIDEFVEVVIDPKIIYQMYSDSCYQYGYSIRDAIGELIDNDGIHFVNTKTGAEYQLRDDVGNLAAVPADCTETVCLDSVNKNCGISSGFEQAEDADCGVCNIEYIVKLEGTLTFNIEFVKNVNETILNLNYNFDGHDVGSFEIDATGLGLSCLNPIESFVFDESDLIDTLSMSFDSQALITFFATNGMFKDCEGNCYEIFPADVGNSPFVLQACTDCTNTPINVSIDDCCNQEVLFKAEGANEITDADKMAFLQNLYNLEYVNCNGASFVEFTYYYNNSDENCQYNSFPACCETVRITVPEELIVDDSCSSSDVSYDISEVLPHNQDISSLISNLVLNCNFIEDFFDSHFTDYCGNINYAIPQSWGQDFLTYIYDTYSKFTADNGICYQLNINECGNYELGLAFEPVVLHNEVTNNNSVEGTFLLVDCGDCGEQPFLLGLSNDQDGIMGNEGFVGAHIELPPEFESDCQIDPCSFLLNLNIPDGLIEIAGFSFNVNCGNENYKYIYTGTDANGTWEILPVVLTEPVVLDLTGNGIQLTAANQSGVQYDMNNDGVKDQVGWIGEGNGLLVYDANNDHTVTNASEFVLTDHVPGAKTDLEALRMGFDTNQDNTLDQQDSAWNQFGVWQDANQDAIVDNGEYHTLAQLGIVSIGLVGQGAEQNVNGNIIHGLSSFAFADGSTGTVADVALRYLDGAASSVHNDTSVTDPAVSNPTVAEQTQVVMAQNDPVVQSALEQMTQQAAVASA